MCENNFNLCVCVFANFDVEGKIETNASNEAKECFCGHFIRKRSTINIDFQTSLEFESVFSLFSISSEISKE